MQKHRLTPEQVMIYDENSKEWGEINRYAWKYRKLTGGALRLALLMGVPENLRDEVQARIQFIQRKHGVIT